MKKLAIFLIVSSMILSALVGCASKPSQNAGSTTPGGTEDSQFVYERVCIIGCDGAGAFFKQANTPNIDRIFENGAVTYTAQSMIPSISAQSWGSMIHGVLPEFHGLDNYNTATNAYSPTSIYPSFFRVVRENDPQCKMASFCKWENINKGIVEDGLGIYKSVANDDVIAQQACSYVEENDPKVLMIIFNDPDTGGHNHTYGSPEHIAAIELTDERIGMIYDAYAARGWIETTLFIVTADHGGAIGTLGHGGLSSAEMNVMFAAAGKTVQKGTVGRMDLRDVASIVTYALGYEQHKSWTSRVPSGLFEGVEAGERPVSEIVFDSEYRNYTSVATPAIGSGKSIVDVLGEERIKAYLTFDDTVDEATQKIETAKNGSLSYSDGIFGKGVDIKEGSVSLKDFSIGTESFTIMLWVKVTGVISSDPLILSNKDWSSGNNKGIAFSLRSRDIKFNYANGTRADHHLDMPGDYLYGWMHIILVYDRELGEIRVSYDFDDFTIGAMNTALQNASLDSGFDDLIIGQDITLNYSAKLPATIDEFVYMSGALTADELAQVKAVYNRS